MPDLARCTGQAVLYALFAAVVAAFSVWPPYSLLEPGQALLRLSFSHPGRISTECRTRSPEELAKLPPQMRSAQDCERARSPVQVRVELDGRVLVDESFAPAGLARDGASSGYRRIPIAAGAHRLRVVFRDDVRPQAPVHERDVSIDVAPGRIVLVDFKAEQGGIVIR